MQKFHKALRLKWAARQLRLHLEVREGLGGWGPGVGGGDSQEVRGGHLQYTKVVLLSRSFLGEKVLSGESSRPARKAFFRMLLFFIIAESSGKWRNFILLEGS